jgi:hypothetical protein
MMVFLSSTKTGLVNPKVVHVQAREGAVIDAQWCYESSAKAGPNPETERARPR